MSKLSPRQKRDVKNKIKILLSSLTFKKVVYCGPIRMARSRHILFYDADFYDRDSDEIFCPREFIGKTKLDMYKIIWLMRICHINNVSV